MTGDASRLAPDGSNLTTEPSPCRKPTRWVVGYMYARPVEAAHLPGRTAQGSGGKRESCAVSCTGSRSLSSYARTRLFCQSSWQGLVCPDRTSSVADGHKETTVGDMGDLFNDMRAANRQQRELNRLKNEQAEDDIEWKKHSMYHWATTLQGDRLDFWPSKNKWRWRNKNYHGDVRGFIRNRAD